MSQDRREFLKKSFAMAGLASTISATQQPFSFAQTQKLGIPGPYPGRVVATHHPGSISGGQYQAEPVRQMIEKGMMELTGAPSPTDAWRVFFERGDVVGIKVNPVGQPFVISDALVLNEIISGLKTAGVGTRDIVVYDRYRRQFLSAGFDKWLPEGARWMAATDEVGQFQLDMDGYDADTYMEMALVLPDADPSNAHHRRSYVANFLSKEVNKMINLCVLKHHQSAGITLALKNLSHGLVNNVSRSHPSSTNNTCNIFIPAVVDLPVIREKVVLNILDGVKGAYHGGPGSRIEKYVWEHRAMYFATDPVAMDKVGWKVLDEKRAEVGMLPIAEAPPDEDSRFLNMQVEHVEIAGALGLGVFDDEKIELKELRLS